MNIKLFLIPLFFLLISCSKKDETKSIKNPKGKQEAEIKNDTSGLSHYDLDSKDPLKINVPRELVELSGITFTPDYRLFGMQDESGVIYQIDVSNGGVIKKFAIGNSVLKKDFEDIVFVDGYFYLLESNGDLYEFKEAGDQEYSEYKLYETELSKSSDAEGLCYDPETNSLLIACKGSSGTGEKNEKAVYSFSLSEKKLDPNPRFVIPISEVNNHFNPSGIERNPLTGSFFIIAANGSEIIEITKEGEIIDRHPLKDKIHPQPEGIAFSKDNQLLISSEGKSGSGSIVIYPFIKK
ncbi:MAG TPA: SdiA-regulated domain-containing protein [Ignavibacteria bacterium]|nr:SdiA-regulated domain-containing protein [Ignavibacteria bacterium]